MGTKSASLEPCGSSEGKNQSDNFEPTSTPPVSLLPEVKIPIMEQVRQFISKACNSSKVQLSDLDNLELVVKIVFFHIP